MSNPDPSQKRVVLMTWPTAASIRGWRRFLDTAGVRWHFEIQHPHDKMLPALERDPPDGMIAYLGTGLYADWVAKQPFPCVNHSAALPNSPVPRICIDDHAAGRLAARHLLERGHTRLGFLGLREAHYSRHRREGFRERALEAGIEPDCLEVPFALTPAERHRTRSFDRLLLDFLSSLPRPAGLFACHDPLALFALECARELGRRIPEDLAIVGMDNDDLCMLAHPPLSSVVPPFVHIAFDCAALLQRMMDGETPDEWERRIPPERIETRQSSDSLVMNDASLAEAVHFMRDRLHEPIKVNDIARHAGLNRRTLEKRFRDQLHCTPLQKLRRLRIDRARELLADPALGIDRIAASTGFGDAPWFATVFKRETGETPSGYRKRILPDNRAPLS